MFGLWVIGVDRNWLGFAKVGKTQHLTGIYIIFDNSKFILLHNTDPHSEELRIMNIHGHDLVDWSMPRRLNPKTSGAQFNINASQNTTHSE